VQFSSISKPASGMAQLTGSRFHTRYHEPRDIHRSMWLFALWLVSFVAGSVTLGLIGTQISDEIEAELPIEQRPSSRLWKVRRFPLAELQQHRRLYRVRDIEVIDSRRRWPIAEI
jgi:hypothetical protein